MIPPWNTNPERMEQVQLRFSEHQSEEVYQQHQLAFDVCDFRNQNPCASSNNSTTCTRNSACPTTATFCTGVSAQQQVGSRSTMLGGGTFTNNSIEGCYFQKNQEQELQEQYDETDRYILWQELLEDCIDQIPLMEKTGYMNALMKCPLEIRNREANPLVFVEFEGYNMFSAARKLVQYWEWRVKLFGDVVAYESILNILNEEEDDDDFSEGFGLHSVTPHDTSADDECRKRASFIRNEFRKLLRNNAVLLLPKQTSDGKHVLVFDKQRFDIDWDGPININSILRVVWYHLTALVNRISEAIQLRKRTSSLARSSSSSSTFVPDSNTNHLHDVAVLGVIYTYKSSVRSLAQDLRRIMLEALPFRYARMHLLFLPRSSSWDRLVEYIAPTVFRSISMLFSTIVPLVSHVSFHEADSMQQLLPYGFSPDMLPVSLGGTWPFPIKPKSIRITNCSAPSKTTACISPQPQLPFVNATSIHDDTGGFFAADVVSYHRAGAQKTVYTHLPEQQLNPCAQLQWHNPSRASRSNSFADAISETPFHENTGHGFVEFRPVASGMYHDTATITVNAFDRNIVNTNHRDQKPIIQHQFHAPQFSWNDLLVDAIEQIPLHEKTGYIGAVAYCPLEIRNREANPARFVEYEGGDINAAAKRLVTYWEWRLLIFGELMAYRSILTDSSSNVGTCTPSPETYNFHQRLWKEFCTLIEYQAMAVLPQPDLDGNFVILYDKSRLLSGCDSELDSHKVLRIGMHNVTILTSRIGHTSLRSTDVATCRGSNEGAYNSKTCNAENKIASFVFIIVAHLFQQSPHNLSQDMCDILLDAVPARFERIHLLFLSDDAVHMRQIRNTLAAVVSETSKLLRQSALVIPHIGSKMEIIQQLNSYGLNSEMILQSLGGKSDTNYEKQPTDNDCSTTTSKGTSVSPHHQDNVNSTLITPHQLHQIVPNLGMNPVSYVRHQHAIADYWRQKIVPLDVTASTSNKRRKKSTR